MCVISTKGKQGIWAIALCCLWSITSNAQDISEMQRLEGKIDSVLALLQKEGDILSAVQETLKKECSEEIVLLGNKHRQEIEKLQTELQRANLNADKLRKENSEQLTKTEQSRAEFKKIIEGILGQIMLGGTSIDVEGIDYFLGLAKEYKADNLQKMEAFVPIFKEVIQLEQEFSGMEDLEKSTAFAWEMHSKTFGYSGLHQEVLSTLFKLKNYCEYEQKLIETIALSQTQSSDENRRKQLLRREDDFTDYPYLISETEKAKVDKEYKLTRKCKR